MCPEGLRIGLDVSCLVPQPLTGVGYFTLHLVDAFLERYPGCDVRLFASSAQGAPAVLDGLARRATRCRSVRFPTRLKTALWTRAAWPPIEWFTGAVDIAHGCFHLLPASRGARRVVTVYDLSGMRQAGTHTAGDLALHRRLLAHAVPRADALVAISESCKGDLVELLGANPDRVHVVYGGVAMAEFEGALDTEALSRVRAKFGIEGDYFIHLGTLEPRKNLPRLLEAYARVRERHGELPRLVLAGRAGWMYEAVFETIRRLGLEDAVIHTGYLERAEAVVLLRGAFACVYPSLYEGFGLPVLEAMAARVPVLTSNVSSLPEVIGETGIQVTPDDVDAIAAGLEDLVERRGEALGRVEAAYARAQDFSWTASAEALAGVYESLR